LFGYAECKSTDLEHVVTAIFYRRIKHSLLPSLYIGENHGIILKYWTKNIAIRLISKVNAKKAPSVFSSF